MYTVVLMTALTAGGNVADHCGGRHGCHGSYCGGYYGSYCSGSYCSGYGGYCSGYGGYCSGYGGYCSGYSGHCHGGWSYGCLGHTHGWGCWGGYGCYGGWSCSGCYGVYDGSFSSPYHAAPVAPVVPMAPSTPTPPKTTGQSNDAVRANLVVEVPQDAKLWIDDMLTKSTGNVRQFQTPPLDPNQKYYYILRAEMQRDGQSVMVSRQVIINPGQSLRTVMTEQAPTDRVTVSSQAPRN